MPFSPKQQEYLDNATHRWNFKTGATRSGKTFLDFACVIAKRITNCTGDGLIMLMGNTQGTLERNVLVPMRNIWGDQLVGNINQKNKVWIFGKECHALGADKINQVSKLQGTGIEYAYGDEVPTWNEEVFQMLKSRLDKSTSVFDGTGNPEGPDHWLKKFLDGDFDIFSQSYALDDNPFNDPKFVAELKREYSGTVYYDRFILGRWVRAEGVIYRLFADNPGKYIIESPKEYLTKTRQKIAAIFIGVDWGHSKSANTAEAVGITDGYREAIVLDEFFTHEELDPAQLFDQLTEFIGGVVKEYGQGCRQPARAYGDNAEQMLVRGLRNTVRQRRVACNVYSCEKRRITDRIVTVNSLFATERYKICGKCEHLISSYKQAVWDSKSNQDVRLDDGSYEVDPLDAVEYAITPVMENLEKAGHLM